MRIFRLGTNNDCGQDIGKYLIRLGHRKVAYLDLELSTPWSTARFEGLQEAYTSCGLKDSVRYVVPGPTAPFEMEAPPIANLALKNLPSRNSAEVLRVFHRDWRIIWESIFDEITHFNMREPLKKLLADTSITAWIAVNDDLAIKCLMFLHEQGIELPQRLSVVGFDDTPEAFFMGLTSYSFNLKGIVRKLVDTVLTSPAKLKRERPVAPVEIPGFVSERRTAGPPPVV
jgi:DNA-binding LacI/PurR family transcriptional regulator